ncbi:uncharacterized protein LOC120001444 isoform X2 [Tripterygium wilfordii]|uniref:uncharacterized protein LOC120001444 isoform X2 n=1 Tax=Tripterygium wilfordii TaxID=458696 RepID=UPI0018F7FD07|nr:uncharacterized protein LOC120001444 isoform X2 [Tripterygium wilfordii]
MKNKVLPFPLLDGHGEPYLYWSHLHGNSTRFGFWSNSTNPSLESFTADLCSCPKPLLRGGSCSMFVIIGGERPCTVLPVDVFAWVHLQHKPLAGAESFLVFICMAILLAQGPNLNSIAGFSFVGAITALSIAEGRPSDVSHGPRKKPDSDIEGHSNVLIAIGIIVLAFRGHNLALEIQATLPSSPEKASKKTMCKGVTVSYALSLVPMSLGYSRILGLWKQGTHRLHAKRRAFDSICAVPWPHDFKVCKRTYIHDDHHKQSVFISNLRDAGFRQLGVQVREHQEEVVSMVGEERIKNIRWRDIIHDSSDISILGKICSFDWRVYIAFSICLSMFHVDFNQETKTI